MKRVVVTGAGGFLGTAVSNSFEWAGYEVDRTDNQASASVDALDVCKVEQLDSLLSQGTTPTAVVHLAAAGADDQGLVAGAKRHTARAVRTNVEGFVHVVEAAARHGVPRIVWSSSTTVYGPAAEYQGPIDESAPLRPTTEYGATKAACEFLGPILSQRLGTEVTAVRLPMVYGPGRWYGGSQAPLVDLTNALETGATVEVLVWEGDADWIHVADASSAILALTEAGTVASAYHTLGHRGGLAELSRQLLAQSGNPDHARLLTTTDGGPDIPPIDDSLLRVTTGWAPRFPSAAKGAASYLGPDTAPSSLRRPGEGGLR